LGEHFVIDEFTYKVPEARGLLLMVRGLAGPGFFGRRKGRSRS